jgi:hypothetical protein
VLQFGKAERFIYCSYSGNLVLRTALIILIYNVAILYSGLLYVLQLTVLYFGKAGPFFVVLYSGSLV